MRSFPVMSLALTAIVAAAAPAAAFDDADRGAIRRTIDGQIDAFRHDDGPAAYAFAAPAIRRMIPTEDGFLAMVRQGYRPVYRPRSYAFGDVRETGSGLDQAVTVQDEDGVDWVAVYSLEKQPDGSWQIAGCALVKAPGQAV